jgi:hypothetical protein
MSLIPQRFVDGLPELLSELSPTFGSRHRGMELDVENVTPPAANVDLGQVGMTIVGQDLRDGRKYALRHRLVILPAPRPVVNGPFASVTISKMLGIRSTLGTIPIWE